MFQIKKTWMGVKVGGRVTEWLTHVPQPTTKERHTKNKQRVC